MKSVIAALLLFAAACDTKGTCLVEHADPKKRDTCAVNSNKRGCDYADTKFFEEDSAAGMLRCHAAGFEVTTDRDQQKRLKNDEMVLFLKPSTGP